MEPTRHSNASTPDKLTTLMNWLKQQTLLHSPWTKQWHRTTHKQVLSPLSIIWQPKAYLHRLHRLVPTKQSRVHHLFQQKSMYSMIKQLLVPNEYQDKTITYHRTRAEQSHKRHWFRIRLVKSFNFSSFPQLNLSEQEVSFRIQLKNHKRSNFEVKMKISKWNIQKLRRRRRRSEIGVHLT